MSLQAGAALVSLALCALNTGCLTKLAYEKLGHPPIRAAWVELTEATPSQVRLVVETEYDSAPSKTSDFEFDPRLDECASVRVLARTQQGDELVTTGLRYSLELGVDEKAASHRRANPWQTGEMVDDCTVAILALKYKEDLWLRAENVEERLGRATVSKPKNAVMLAAVLPAAIIVDVASAPLVIAKMCLTDSSCVRSILESLETSH